MTQNYHLDVHGSAHLGLEAWEQRLILRRTATWRYALDAVAILARPLRRIRRPAPRRPPVG
jgi:hypothetical protein